MIFITESHTWKDRLYIKTGNRILNINSHIINLVIPKYSVCTKGVFNFLKNNSWHVNPMAGVLNCSFQHRFIYGPLVSTIHVSIFVQRNGFWWSSPVSIVIPTTIWIYQIRQNGTIHHMRTAVNHLPRVIETPWHQRFERRRSAFLQHNVLLNALCHVLKLVMRPLHHFDFFRECTIHFDLLFDRIP